MDPNQQNPYLQPSNEVARRAKYTLLGKWLIFSPFLLAIISAVSFYLSLPLGGGPANPIQTLFGIIAAIAGLSSLLWLPSIIVGIVLLIIRPKA